jgi:hypothetical protein
MRKIISTLLVGIAIGLARESSVHDSTIGLENTKVSIRTTKTKIGW